MKDIHTFLPIIDRKSDPNRLWALLSYICTYLSNIVQELLLYPHLAATYLIDIIIDSRGNGTTKEVGWSVVSLWQTGESSLSGGLNWMNFQLVSTSHTTCENAVGGVISSNIFIKQEQASETHTFDVLTYFWRVFYRGEELLSFCVYLCCVSISIWPKTRLYDHEW